jgi:hypothetical protein
LPSSQMPPTPCPHTPGGSPAAASA